MQNTDRPGARALLLRAYTWEDAVPEKRIVLFMSVSVMLVILLAGCKSREERIELPASTTAANFATNAARSPSVKPPTATASPTGPAAAEHTTATSEAQATESSVTGTPTVARLQSPTATPTPASFGPPRDGLAVVTFDERGRTALLHSGDRLVLTLGDGYVWHLRVSGVEVLVPLATSMLPPGTQAVFQARKAGKAIVGATGEPVCRPGWTNCNGTIVQFELTVIVTD